MNIDDLRPCMKYTMTVRQLAAILCIHANAKIMLRDVAALLGVSRPSITRIFDTLCGHGLMKRMRDEADHRNVYAVLTPKGVKLAEELTT